MGCTSDTYTKVAISLCTWAAWLTCLLHYISFTRNALWAVSIANRPSDVCSLWRFHPLLASNPSENVGCSTQLKCKAFFFLLDSRVPVQRRQSWARHLPSPQLILSAIVCSGDTVCTFHTGLLLLFQEKPIILKVGRSSTTATDVLAEVCPFTSVRHERHANQNYR